MNKQIQRGLIAAGVLVAAASANAAAIDFSPLTGNVDLAAVGAAILAIGALLMVPNVTKYGVRKILGMIGR